MYALKKMTYFWILNVVFLFNFSIMGCTRRKAFRVRWHFLNQSSHIKTQTDNIFIHTNKYKVHSWPWSGSSGVSGRSDGTGRVFTYSLLRDETLWILQLHNFTKSILIQTKSWMTARGEKHQSWHYNPMWSFLIRKTSSSRRVLVQFLLATE